MSISSFRLTDRTAFEQFKQAHPELGSALKIAAISEAEFVRTYGHSDGLDPRQAYRIHQTAVQIQQQTALVWANLKDMASPFLRQTLFNNIPQSFLEQQQQIPGYDRLFGSLDFIECDESRSVLSPAAYFVDLMRFIETNITSPNSNPDADQGIPEDCRLDQRRLDLFHLRLDDDNTHTLIPYIDLVNQVLETLVTTPDQADAEAAIAEAVFPQSLPLNLPLAEIRTYLNQLDLDLPQLYDTLAPQPEAVDAVRRREQLALSPEEFALLGQPLVDQPDRLAAVYGFETLPEALAGLASVTTFLDRTGLSRQQLSDLLFQDLDQAEVNAGLARLCFINAVDDGLGHLQIESDAGDADDPTRPPTETLLNLSAAKLDRVYRFLKLARRLAWSFVDLDWALRSLSTPCTPERVLQFDGLNDFVQVPAPGEPAEVDQPQGLATLGDSFTLEAWVNPTRHQANPILSRGQEGNLDIHFLLCLTADGRVAFYGTASEDDAPAISVQPVPVGEFTHVAVTVQTARNQSTVRLYLNGEPTQLELQGQFDQAVTLPAIQPPTGDLAVNIGRNLSDTTFAGLIKEVRVWSQGRSPESVAANRYRRFSGFEPGLVAYWPLTESHGLELLDRTPYGQHGVPGGDHLVTQPRWVTADLVLEPLPPPIGATRYRFNGVDQYLARRGVTGLSAEQLTLEAWVYLDAAGVQPILHLGSAGDRQSHLWFGVNQQNQLVFRSASLGDQDFGGDGTIDLERLTHVAVTVDNREVRFYLNGSLDRRRNLPRNSTFRLEGDDLSIGHDFSDRYLSGILHEVRLWSQVRRPVDLNSFLQRSVPALTPGLIGYWPLADITAEQAADLSLNGNALYLGGVPADFQPAPVTVAPLQPALPVAIPGTALWFNGDRDRVVLRQDANFGLGRHPRFTLEFWFKPTPPTLHPEAPQLLFSQGDGEAGLAIYVEQQRLYGIAWCANYELTEVQETVLASDPTALSVNQWHHVAIVHDETQHLDYIEFRGFLDGIALDEISTTHPNQSLEAGQRGHRLSPVGPAYLGHLDDRAITRLTGDYVRLIDSRLQGFSGQMADLRLWNRAKTAADVEAERYHDPRLFGAGLIAYLPLDEGHDVTVTDRVNGYTGQLRGETAVLMAAPRQDPEWLNRYTHYQPAETAVLDWRNYRFTGLLYVPDLPADATTGGLGVTVLSRHPEAVDQFYRLALTWPEGQPTFSLDAHPQGVQPLEIEQADFPAVEPDRWYAFSIEVTDEQSAARTRLAVSLWPAGTAAPDAPQGVAYDTSDVRLTSGTVGLWVAGHQPQTLAARFNNLRLVTLDEADQGSEELLKTSFTEYLPGDTPEGWVSTVDRLTPEDTADLFQALDLNGKTVLGTDSSLTGTTAHYAPAGEDTLGWSHYRYQGKLRFTEADSGIGLTVLSRTPAGVDQYYALRRDADQPTFQLVGHPLGVQPLTAEPDSSLDSGVLPEPDTDYRVTIEVEAGAEATHLRAKIWVAGTLEPEDFQIKAVDSSDVRITAGTVGVWTAGPGRKTFDDLKVLQETLLAEDFSAYGPEADPADWGHTGAENSRQAVPDLFRTAEQDGVIALGTQSRLGNIHSHYQPAEALDWTSYTYTGRMLITPESSGSFDGIGVTFFSRYPDPDIGPDENHDQYYRLRRFGGLRTFHIAPHPHDVRRVNTAGRDTGVNPQANTWYRFLIEAHDGGDRTLIRAKIWPEGTPEPTEFQANTSDDNNGSNRDRRRLTAGTVGLWTARAGEKYFADLTVRRGVYLSAALDLEDWLTTGARDPFEPDETLFAVERIPDHPMWRQADDIPLLRRPLNLQALDFDGDRQYLALASLTGGLGSGFTLEAWIQPRAIDRANPVVSWGPDTWFGLNDEGQITLVTGESLRGDISLPTDAFTHVAIAVADDRVSLYVNGALEVETPVSEVDLPLPTAMQVGRSGTQYFGGQIRDLRLWSTGRSEFPVAQRYQTPDLTADALLAYWPFAEVEQAYSLDTSTQANHLRLGGLEPARKPTLLQGDRPSDALFWQQPQTSLSFTAPQDGLLVPAIAAPPKRYTVELWVKVNDPTLTQRQQVIYHRGDGQQGLVIYVHDGRLYLGGYDQAAGWSGTWLSSDRILAERWHHVALVLDGRPELRPHALRAYLDGKLIGVGDGRQLSAAGSAHLGLAAGDVRFHDGLATATDTHLVGAVLELRLWTTARTTAEIRANRYGALSGDESHLALWWRFDGITEANPEVVDGSGQGQPTSLADLDRLQPLAPLPPGGPPTLALTPATLVELASFQQLIARHRQSVERLTALWHDLRHTGRADGRVFFDQVFNPTGGSRTPWRYHDPARRWDVTGQELPSRDRAIRSRLMGALQVSSDDLDALVRQLSGSETTLALDTPYLRQLYRLSQIPRALRLSLREYLLLLEMVGLSQVASLADLERLSQRITAIRRIGLNVDLLNFFAYDVPSASVRPPYTDATLRNVADDLANQSIEFLVTPITFVSDQISEFESGEIVAFFRPNGDDITVGALTRRYFVDDLGAVSDRYQTPEDLQDLAIAQDWAAPFSALPAEAFSALQTAGFVNEYGILLRPEDLDLPVRSFLRRFLRFWPQPSVNTHREV
ncbi:LamG-like jellyroll fold domain-containing protein, partial [Nodosilinea sp. P-1105]|uniref:LamG-like jellyroll fold domain-containing protein n=1 Tax=Nodosilinea sp. P-1105 TaxID=2546229 RepID=UPI0016BADC50